MNPTVESSGVTFTRVWQDEFLTMLRELAHHVVV